MVHMELARVIISETNDEQIIVLKEVEGARAFPIVIAYARRIWRRHAVTVSMPPELTDRMQSLERAMDAVAIEVERVGEGQRFVTQLLAGRAQAASVGLPPSREGRPGA